MKIEIYRERHQKSTIKIDAIVNGARIAAYQVWRWGDQYKLATHTGKFIAQYKTREAAIKAAAKRIVDNMNMDSIPIIKD